MVGFGSTVLSSRLTLLVVALLEDGENLADPIDVGFKGFLADLPPSMARAQDKVVVIGNRYPLPIIIFAPIGRNDALVLLDFIGRAIQNRFSLGRKDWRGAFWVADCIIRTLTRHSLP